MVPVRIQLVALALQNYVELLRQRHNHNLLDVMSFPGTHSLHVGKMYQFSLIGSIASMTQNGRELYFVSMQIY